jgi:predicted dehydrogenase
MKGRIKIAVIGVGRWGELHAQKLASIPQAELVGVVDILPERAQEVAWKVGSKPFSDYRELLGKVEAVSIATPTSVHYEIARDFLLNGTHVLLEKPMTSNLEEAIHLEEISKSRNLILQIGHLERFNGAIEGIRDFLKDIKKIEVIRHSPWTERNFDIDVVLDLMIHDLDLLEFLLGIKVKRLKAWGKRVKTPFLDEAQAIIETEEGMEIKLSSSRVAHQKVRNIRFLKEQGELILDLLNHSFVFKENGLIKKGGKKKDALKEEIEAFLRSIREGSSPPVSAKEGLKALQLALEISKLASSG